MRPALPGKRWLLWLALLAAAAGLALFGDKTPAGASAASAGKPVLPWQAPLGRNVPKVEAIQRLVARADLTAAASSPQADLFAPPSWRARPAASPVTALPAAVTPPPAPLMPPPYRVIGKKLEAEGWEVFLGRDDVSFLARDGDTLEATWRVERIEPPALRLRHLPSGQMQTLDIGNAL